MAQKRAGEVDAVLLQPHTEGADYHMWVVLPGWKGTPVTVRRDAIGRRVRTRASGEDWLVLICNNSGCIGRCAVRNKLIEDVAERALPVPPRRGI